MKKILIYAMEGKKMCFLHALMNAKQLKGGGHDVKIVIEGQACTLIGELEKDENKLYLSLKEDGTIAGVCLACSKVLEVYDTNKASGIPFLDDMNGHAGTLSFVDDGYEVIVF
ncbi:MAG: hypothetical protein ACOYCB_09425 [Fastidiosipilaceae bacterium]|jgi:hypothetical protein|nr:hypothetical protein [Clostridiaceae bacterium]